MTEPIDGRWALRDCRKWNLNDLYLPVRVSGGVFVVMFKCRRFTSEKK